MLSFFVLAVQINRIFDIGDVSHLLHSRISVCNVNVFDHTNGKGNIVPTALPTRAVASLKSSRVHFFLHDHQRFRRCLWDGHVMFDDKTEIVCDMLEWFNRTQPLIEHYFTDDEDCNVFSEAMDLILES